MNAPRCVVVLGPPGAGKSTLTQSILSALPGAGWFGVRRYFAQAMAEGTALGRQAEPYARAKQWLPDTLVVQALHQYLDSGGAGQVCLLEGLPARLSQVDALRQCLIERGSPSAVVLHLDTPLTACLTRARTRWVCQHCDWGSAPAQRVYSDGVEVCARCAQPVSRRWNDTDEEFSARLRTYHCEAAAIVADVRSGTEHYVWLDGLSRPELIAERALLLLEGAPA